MTHLTRFTRCWMHPSAVQTYNKGQTESSRVDRLKEAYTAHRKEFIFLVVLIVAAFFTRFYHIDNQVLWWDEFGTHFFGRWSFSDIVEWDNNSPSYYLLEGWIVRTFGKTEFVIKFISAFAGALTVPLMYLIARKMFDSIPSAVMASMLTLMSPIMVLYSQEARAFSFGMFFLLCALYAFLFMMEKDYPVAWISFAVCSAVSIHMQYIFAVPVALILVLTVTKKVIDFVADGMKNGIHKDSFRIFIVPLIALLVFAALMYPVIYAFMSSFKTSIALPGTWLTGWDLIKDMLFNTLFGTKFAEWFLILLITVGAVFLLAKKTDKGVLLLMLCLIPIAAMTYLSSQTHVHMRYMIYVAPVFYLLASAAILPLKDKMSYSMAGAIACSAILLIAAAPVLIDHYNEPQDGNFKEMCGVLSDNIEEGDCIVYSPRWLFWGIEGGLSFYFDSDDKDYPIIHADTVEELETVIADPQYNNIYLIVYGEGEVKDWGDTDPHSTLLFEGCVRMYKVTK